MPTITNWLNPDRSIYFVRYIGHWHPLDVYYSIVSINKDIQTVEHTVVILIDLTESESNPSNLLLIERLIHQEARLPKNVDKVYFFGGDLYLEIIVDTAKEIYGNKNKMQYTGSYATALHLINERLKTIERKGSHDKRNIQSH